MQNEELAKELQKPIIRKFEKGKVHLSFIYNLCGSDLQYLTYILRPIPLPPLSMLFASI